MRPACCVVFYTSLFPFKPPSPFPSARLTSVLCVLTFHDHTATDIVHIYPVERDKKKKRNLFKRCETWLVPVDVLIVAAVRVVSVLLRVSCVQMLVPTPLPSHLPSLVVHGAVLTGTASFFLYIATCRRGAIKMIFPTHSVCVVTRVMSNSRTPGCELPKGGHTYLVNALPPPSDDPIA